MRYAQLYITDHRGQVEKLGPDGVVPMDGRWSTFTMHQEAARHAKQRGCTGYQLRSGESYSRSSPFTKIVQLKEPN